MSGRESHLTCQDLVEVLTDYLEGTMGPDERAAVERHLVICRGCSAYVRQMRGTVELLVRLADQPAGPVPPALMEAFRDWRRDHPEAAP